MDHSWKRSGKFSDLFYIDRSSNIRSTTPDKGSDARLFSGSYLSFRRIFFRSNQRSPCFSDGHQGSGGCATGLDDTGRNIFGFCEGPAGKNTRTVRLGRSEILGVTALMGIEFKTEG